MTQYGPRREHPTNPHALPDDRGPGLAALAAGVLDDIGQPLGHGRRCGRSHDQADAMRTDVGADREVAAARAVAGDRRGEPGVILPRDGGIPGGASVPVEGQDVGRHRRALPRPQRRGDLLGQVPDRAPRLSQRQDEEPTLGRSCRAPPVPEEQAGEQDLVLVFEVAAGRAGRGLAFEVNLAIAEIDQEVEIAEIFLIGQAEREASALQVMEYTELEFEMADIHARRQVAEHAAREAAPPVIGKSMVKAGRGGASNCAQRHPVQTGRLRRRPSGRKDHRSTALPLHGADRALTCVSTNESRRR